MFVVLSMASLLLAAAGYDELYDEAFVKHNACCVWGYLDNPVFGLVAA